MRQAHLLVLERALALGKHVQARREELDRRGEDGELALLGLAGVSRHADNVSAAEVSMVLLEVALVHLGIRHDLDLDTVPAEVVENQCLTRSALAEDPASYRHSGASVVLAVGNTAVLLPELGQRDDTLPNLGELVGIGVVAGSLHVLHHLGAVLEVGAGVEVLLVVLGRGDSAVDRG